MASTNQSPFYKKAEEKYLTAQTISERLKYLEEMIKECPKHKSSEKMLSNLKNRYKKIKESLEKQKKSGKSSKEGIKKEGVRVVLCGLTNSGKSSVLTLLTNAHSNVAAYEFTTKKLIVGTMHYQGVNFQMIDMPAINHEDFDSGILHSADIILICITNTKEIQEINPFLGKTTDKKIIVFNKSDLLSPNEKRKIESTLKTKKYNFVIFSSMTKQGEKELKEKLLENSGVIRIYTKEPGKQPDNQPVTMNPGSTIENVAKKIFHREVKIKEIKVTGPSSKFPNQKVGLKHILKDKDVVEFHTD